MPFCSRGGSVWDVPAGVYLVPSLPWLLEHRDHSVELNLASLGSPHCWGGFCSTPGEAEQGKALESRGICGDGSTQQRSAGSRQLGAEGTASAPAPLLLTPPN